MCDPWLVCCGSVWGLFAWFPPRVWCKGGEGHWTASCGTLGALRTPYYNPGKRSDGGSKLDLCHFLWLFLSPLRHVFVAEFAAIKLMFSGIENPETARKAHETIQCNAGK